MAMRVTQRTMYNGFVNNMQRTLAQYMESNIQGASQKRVNRPSDDPAGMALILNTRQDILNTRQYQKNVDTATGWLSLADQTLLNASTTLNSIKTLAEQAATGDMTTENRQQISFQLRQLFGTLLNLSNTEFEGNSIFAGHKLDQNAYEEGLAVTTLDQNITGQFSVSGKSDKTIAVQFTSNGTVDATGATGPINYRWSNDGGKTWTDATMAAGDTKISMNGVEVTLAEGTYSAADTTKDPMDDNGTLLYVRPTAIYMGDDKDMPPVVDIFGGPAGMTTNVQGTYNKNVQVRMETPAVDLRTAGQTLNYSYSTDNGATWIKASTQTTGNNSARLSVPGGYMDIEGAPSTISINAGGGAPAGMTATVQGNPPNGANIMIQAGSTADLNNPGDTLTYSVDGGTTWLTATVPNPANGKLTLPGLPGGGSVELGTTPPNTTITGTGAPIATISSPPTNVDPGTQFIIHPKRANLDYEIMQNSYLSVNSVGKDIFGGMYEGKAVFGGSDQNIFEVVGKLIGYCETNNSDGIGKSVDALTTALEGLQTANTRIGALENRLSLAKDFLSFQKLDQEERLSYTEDMDLTELLNNLARQELAYNSVLKSSSMIMQLNLTKFI